MASAPALKRYEIALDSARTKSRSPSRASVGGEFIAALSASISPRSHRARGDRGFVPTAREAPAAAVRGSLDAVVPTSACGWLSSLCRRSTALSEELCDPRPAHPEASRQLRSVRNLPSLKHPTPVPSAFIRARPRSLGLPFPRRPTKSMKTRPATAVLPRTPQRRRLLRRRLGERVWRAARVHHAGASG